MTQIYFKNNKNELFAIDNDKYCTDEFIAEFKAKHNLVEIAKSEYDLILKELNTQTDEEILISFRANRDALLKEVDIYQGVLIYSELTDIQKNELKQYRLDLLESTETLVLPNKPSFIKD